MDYPKRSPSRTVVLFGISTPSLNALQTVATEILPNPISQYIEHMYQDRKTGEPILLLQTADYTKAANPDFIALREIFFHLQRYIKDCIQPGKTHSFSAVFFHNFSDEEPSIAAQWNAGAVRTICERLNISPFWIAPVTSDHHRWIESQILQTNLNFRAATDFSSWSRCLPPSNCKSLSDLLAIDAKTAHCNWKAPQDELTAITYDHLVHRYIQDLLVAERSKRQEYHTELQNVQNHAHCKIEEAKQKLEDANLRYNLLLRQVNIGDNTEGSGIVQQFQALNNMIDELSIDMGQQVPDALLEQFPNTSSCYQNTRSHESFPSSRHGELLVALAGAGASMDIQEFLGLLLGSIICEYLSAQVFEPFYPLEEEETGSGMLDMVYKHLRKRTPQMQSAKWRIDTFTTLLDMDNRKHGRAKIIAARCEKAMIAAFQGLFGYRQKLDVGSKLEALFQDAWELNCLIKTKVAHLGDYETEYFPCKFEYHGSHMKVLDAEPGDQPPGRILLTCGLGLKTTKAVGENKDLESTVVEKATVVSPDVYM
ncbi:hypothetical protein BDV93DRAFT_566575 [Ceratobasidium sp. AG-I]|nr:hypothetical protein BDV93DRAFT_566575 [Ceratobasidium sp. AG-I]